MSDEKVEVMSPLRSAELQAAQVRTLNDYIKNKRQVRELWAANTELRGAWDATRTSCRSLKSFDGNLNAFINEQQTNEDKACAEAIAAIIKSIDERIRQAEALLTEMFANSPGPDHIANGLNDII